MTYVVVHRAAVVALGQRGGGLRRWLQEAGDAVADRAQTMAPKESGDGANSIRAEVVKGYDGTLYARVSWDQDHFYMFFHEVGTSQRSARPFLRPALDAIK